MKLRLSITVKGGNTIAFEHPGPMVRIGRDADCELFLQGEASTGVSRQHARIDLGSDGATLADLGSSNGTLLNDKRLDKETPLRAGDRIQLGYTGPTLTVLELDLSPQPSPALLTPKVLIGAATALALALVVVAVMLLPRKPKPNQPAEPPATVVALPEPPVKKPPIAVAAAPEPVKPPPPVVQVPVPVEESTAAAPSVEAKEVGAYVALDHWVSVLLQRQGEAYPWAVLRPEAKVSTGCTLVSLPGYRSLIDLNSGLHLTLWGNLPEFSPFPPVLESVVMLHAPAAGFDLDFTLDRGRVVVTNRKPSGGARIRLRFLREAWEMELQDAKSEVGLELWALPRSTPAGTPASASYLCLGLFTKGRVQVRRPRQTLDLGDHSRLSWVSQAPEGLNRSTLPDLPAWWGQPPERKSPAVQKALRSLLDWSDQLGGSNTDPTNAKTPVKRDAPVITTIKTQVEEVKDPDNQDTGILFLGALDQWKPLIGLLKDRQNPNVRGATLYALQSWLSRDGRHSGELAQALQLDHGDSKDNAERVVRLLHFYSPEDINQAKTYEDLVGCLDNDNLLVRELAFWQLDQIGVGGRLPEEVKKIDYDPTWETEKRQPAIAQWKKLLAEGKVPVPERK